MIDPARSREPGVDDSTRQSSLSRQMQQLLEWERALYEARTRAEGNTAAQDDAASTTADDPPPEPAATARPFSPPSTSPAPAETSSPRAQGNTSGPTASPPSATPAIAPAPSPSNAEAPTIGATPRAASVAANPLRSSVSVPAPAAPPPPSPETATARELPQSGFYEKDGAVRMWMRDSSVEGAKLTRLLPSLRRTIAKLGLRLSAFTLNGRLVFEEDASASRPTPETGRPDTGRLDDRY